MSLDISLYFDVDTGGEQLEVEAFELNITHNLTGMADEAGLYECIWRPEGSLYKTAYDILPRLLDGIEYMENNREKLELLNPKNGWGSYYILLNSAKAYAEACAKYPKASIHAWR